MSISKYLRGLGVVSLVWAYAWGANQYPSPLPNFQVNRPDGTAMTSAQIGQTGNWFLVYTKANCPNCDKFLLVLSQTGNASLFSHLVVVIDGATPDKLPQIAAKFPVLSGTRWFTDSAQSCASALQIKALPVIFGIRASTVSWSIVGIPGGDRTKLKSILKGWISP